MFAVTTKQGGMCQAIPDVCKVPAPPGPPVPTPFPNIADCMQVNPATASFKVKVIGMPVVHAQSKIMMSSGDEGGSLGGVVSGMIKGEMSYAQASLKVKVEGQPVVFVGCMTAHNGTNANAPGGSQVAPSQAKVFVGS